jgi:hypothetical protein
MNRGKKLVSNIMKDSTRLIMPAILFLGLLFVDRAAAQNPPLPGVANATNFAVAGTITFSPADPKDCEKIFVEYLNLEGVPTNTVVLQLQVLAKFINQETTTNLFTLLPEGTGSLWTNSFYLTFGVTQLVVSVVNDKGLTDNNKGSNWVFDVTTCENAFVRPEVPVTSRDSMTIYVQPRIPPLTSATSITAVANFNTGEQISQLMTKDTNSGLWSVTIDDLPRFATNVSIAFAVTGGDATNVPISIALTVPPFPVKGDVDGDGFGDVMIRHNDTGFAALLGLATNQIVSAGYIGGGFSFDPLQLVGSSDLNIDGTEDMIWRYGDTDYYIWSLMDGTNILDADQLFDEEMFHDWEIIAVADFNLDESGDLLVRHKQYNVWAVAYLDDRELTEILFVPGSVEYAAWTIVASGDVDGDGSPDLVAELGQTRIYGVVLMNNNTISDFSSIMGETSASLAPWKITGLTDADGNGPVEIITQLVDTGYHELNQTSWTNQTLKLTGEALGGLLNGMGSWRVFGPK